MRTEFLRFNGAVEENPAITAWTKEHDDELGAIAASVVCGDAKMWRRIRFGVLGYKGARRTLLARRMA
jgi:hypothetical protein